MNFLFAATSSQKREIQKVVVPVPTFVRDRQTAWKYDAPGVVKRSEI